MIKTVNVIILDKATPDQLNDAHKIIKTAGSGWWHRFTNAWLVGGDLTPKEWRDRLKEVVVAPASALVLRLPSDEAERLWAMRGPDAKERAQWFHRNYK